MYTIFQLSEKRVADGFVNVFFLGSSGTNCAPCCHCPSGSVGDSPCTLVLQNVSMLLHVIQINFSLDYHELQMQSYTKKDGGLKNPEDAA